MNCKSCGSAVAPGEKFCGNCGAVIFAGQNTGSTVNTNTTNTVNQNLGGQNNYGIQNPSMGFQNSVNNGMSEDYLLDAFIVKNAEKFKTRKFSVGAFFFGAFYFMYRKMYLYGILFIVISLALNILLGETAMGAAQFVACFFSNKLYLDFAKKQVEKIKDQNPGLSNEQMMLLCTKKGGTSIVSAILFLVIYSILLSVLNTTL